MDRLRSHSHHHVLDESQVLETAYGTVRLYIFEEDAPPCFRVQFLDGAGHTVPAPPYLEVSVETLRADTSRQRFELRLSAEDYLEATDVLPEPHQFAARLTILGPGGHVHTYAAEFVEHDDNNLTHGARDTSAHEAP